MTLLQHFGQQEVQNKPKKHQFPLLKLPRVLLFDCIQNLNIFEIILFSRLSKRAKSIAKRIRWDPLNIHLTSDKDPQIWLKHDTVQGLDWIIDYNNQKKSSVYPVFETLLKGPQAFHSLFLKDNGNVIEDVKQMMEHICEVFRSPISDIRIFEESFIEWIIQFQPTIQCVWIRKDVITSVETMERMLKNITMTEFFGLQPTEIDKKFQITEPIPSRSIAIYNSFWITLPSILNGSNSIIRLFDSNLTAKDINTILKEWQIGNKLQSLEYLEIQTPKIDTFARPDYNNEILKDLNLTVSVDNNGRPNTVNIDNDVWTYTLPQTQPVYNLIRNDGMIGSIFGTYEVFQCGHQWIICYHQTKELEGPIFESKLHGPSVNHYFILKDNGNVIEDSKQVVEHICEVFSSPISEITITETSLIEWLIKFQPTIQNVWINKHARISAESLNRIFKSLKVTNHFQLKSIPTDEEIKITERISCPYISIHNSHWFTVPLILNGNNSIIRLYDSNLTPKNINFILRQWQLGFKLQNLEYLEIETVTLLDIDSCIREIWKSFYRKANFGTDGRPTKVILFSLLSKRAKTITKLIHWSPSNIYLKTVDTFGIQFRCSMNPGRKWLIVYRKTKEPSGYLYQKTYLIGPRVFHLLVLKHCRTAIKDLGQMTEHVCEVFRSTIDGVDIGRESQIKWIIKFQPSIPYVFIPNDVVTSVETLHRVFKNLKVTDSFHLKSIAIDESVQYSEPIQCRSISISNSFWVTLPSILNGSNAIIRLRDSKLTPKDFNTLLKEWQMGSKLQKLELAEIELSTTLDLDRWDLEVLNDLDWTAGNVNDGRPTTVILFSLLSKRAKTIVKLIRWNPLNIRFITHGGPVIQLKCFINPGRTWMIAYENGEESSGYPYYTSILTGPKVVYRLTLIDHENATEDLKQMVEHICEVFRSPIGCIYIAEESLIEWIIKLQPTLRNVWIKKNVIISVETLDRILKNLKVTGCFHLDSIAVDENFQYTEPIPFRFIAINNAYWVSSSSILNGNNSIIRLSGSKLAPKDINTMLKEWQMGTKLRKLEFLEVRISTPLDIETFAAAFKDLDGTLSDGNDGRPNTVKMREDFIFTLPPANKVLNLTRTDGMIGSLFATSQVYGHERHTYIRTYFQVWSHQP
ncbi:hypothetical protein B9Z55_012308 [Caenorhabditis nigoni]|nr:hypothetical protein B9Z55_012308 [Caenorhabditis nigoni]